MYLYVFIYLPVVYIAYMEALFSYLRNLWSQDRFKVSTTSSCRVHSSSAKVLVWIQVSNIYFIQLSYMAPWAVCAKMNSKLDKLNVKCFGSLGKFEALILKVLAIRCSMLLRDVLVESTHCFMIALLIGNYQDDVLWSTHVRSLQEPWQLQFYSQSISRKCKIAWMDPMIWEVLRMHQVHTRYLYRQPTLKSEETPQQFLELTDSPALDCFIITTCLKCLKVYSTKTAW